MLVDDDVHLALHCLYELTYRSFVGVDPALEGDPALLALRRRLEDAFLAALRRDTIADGGAELAEVAQSRGPAAAVEILLERFSGPSLSSYTVERGTRWQFEEFMIHRSAYQLKEADPHTMGLARLVPGHRKSAFVEIQYDEYGSGRAGESHAELFASAMASAGLSPDYGHYLDVLPGVTLATGNLLGLFASRRELLGALVGHLAAFEMTSVVPMARYAEAARRLGLGADVRHFYDIHVVADTHHGDLARRFLLGDRRDADDLEPAQMVFGAHSLIQVEDRLARRLLEAWRAGRSSLLGADLRRLTA